jgi:hypothetical protein
MAKISRVTIMLLSCLSLTVLGTASSASAHPRHAVPTTVRTGVRAGAHSNGDGWCC